MEENEKPTLRDQFAMAALTGMCALGDEDGYNSYVSDHQSVMADRAYKIADAMMDARQ